MVRGRRRDSRRTVRSSGSMVITVSNVPTSELTSALPPTDISHRRKMKGSSSCLRMSLSSEKSSTVELDRREFESWETLLSREICISQEFNPFITSAGHVDILEQLRIEIHTMHFSHRDELSLFFFYPTVEYLYDKILLR